jgi:sec-independent protein translocase protein TatA
MGSLGPWELGIIGVIVVLMFGTKRLPELGSGLGKAISNFKKSYKEASAIDVTPSKDGDAEPTKTSEAAQSEEGK